MNSTKINKKKYVKTLPDSISAPLAEVYGALIGDGCLSTHNSISSKSKWYVTMLTGHTHDWEYYEKVIRPIFIKEFGMKGSLLHRSKKRGNCIDYVVHNKGVFSWFKSKGFPVGRKIKLMIPKSITGDNKLSLVCVRGIFDTDGSIYDRYSKRYKNHSKKYTYMNIEIKMNHLKLIKQIKEILERNGVKTSNIRKHRESHVLNIHNQEYVRLFFELVKPSNPYHRERFLNLRRIVDKQEAGP